MRCAGRKTQIKRKTTFFSLVLVLYEIVLFLRIHFVQINSRRICVTKQFLHKGDLTRPNLIQ